MFNSGGNYGNGTNAGVGYSNGNWTNRGNVNVNIGFRSALPPYARSRSATDALTVQGDKGFRSRAFRISEKGKQQ